MNESKFTPGPWLIQGSTVYALDETGNCNRFSVRPEGGWTWRSAGSICVSGDRTTEAELEANARLIAAAPDMYAALAALANEPTAEEVARSRLPELSGRLALADSITFMRVRADLDTANKLAGRAALAKARGEAA